jgi:hypothetical protein
MVWVFLVNRACHPQGTLFVENARMNEIDHQTETTSNVDLDISALSSKGRIICEACPSAIPANDQAEPVFEG